jgi:hypothetical protein
MRIVRTLILVLSLALAATAVQAAGPCYIPNGVEGR